ncbi:MAG TPA: VCBS repeat-containing protein [Longimicrobium sp.]|jgi:hypothetical protein|nr:VCBS repeat-containing protein [Longimicrobium sp.]
MRIYARAVLLVSACTCAAPATAQGIHPVLDAKSGYVLGAPVNGTWQDGRHVAGRVGAGRRYRVFGSGGLLGVSSGTRPQSVDEPCAESFAVELSPAREEGEVAVDGAWNVLPRPVTRLSAAAAAGYAGAVRQILLQHGIRAPMVRVTGAVRADLDGDGTEEVIVSAFRSTGNGTFTVGAGDYSLVFVRKLVGGVVRTIMLEQEYHPRAKGETTTNEYTIAGAWDLDGDGKLEIVIRASYYEGGWTTLYRIRGTTVQTLVSAGCGA